MEIINWQLARNPVNYLIIGLMAIIGAFAVDAIMQISAKAGTLAFTGSGDSGQ